MQSSTKVLLLFDLTMSYVMEAKDEKLKFKLKQLFNDWEKSGRRLWKLFIKMMQNDGTELEFDNMVIEVNEVFRQYFESNDRHTLIALMKSFNQGNVTILPEPEIGAKEEAPKSEIN